MAPRLAVLFIVAFLLIPLTRALAADQASEPAGLKVEQQDTIKSLLERHAGKRVTIRLGSGDELTGTVRVVGNHVVHLSELAGRDFYDAVIALDDIVAVVVRVRGT